jgi:hypothetical protein
MQEDILRFYLDNPTHKDLQALLGRQGLLRTERTTTTTLCWKWRLMMVLRLLITDITVMVLRL